MVVLLQVQLVPCEELDTKHYGSGLPLVTKLRLIESKARVGLQDRSTAIVPAHGVNIAKRVCRKQVDGCCILGAISGATRGLGKYCN
jgi:hypothetical protein